MSISNLLQRVISWLQVRPFLNIILVFAYFIFIAKMHDNMVHVSMWVQGMLTLDIYNHVVVIVYLIFLCLLGAFLWQQFKTHRDNIRLKLVYLFVTVGAILIHSRFMFESNIEVIHSFEYTFLAFLVFPLSRRFGAGVFFVLPFMLFDEWYQYKVLYPDLDYFDLNDVMMDTYGCGLTMVALMIAGIKGATNIPPFWKRAEFISLVSMIVVVLIAAKLCFITAYASDACSNTYLVMNERTIPELFWRYHIGHHIWFHVMKPVEGMIAISLLHFFYFGMDSFRK